jgi:methionyl-tRNA formyltransferase
MLENSGMIQKLTIAILTDELSWMNKYNTILVEELKKMGHKAVIIHSKNELQKGDIAFFLSCFEIIPKKYLALHTNNIVVHESNLPQGKGWSPMSWQILEGKNNIPVTLFEAVEKVDSGDIYIQDTIHLAGNELLEEWRALLGKKTCQLCVEYVKNYPHPSRKQSGESSFYPRRTPKDSELDPSKNIQEQFNLLRIVDNENYPAFFIYNNRKYRLKIYVD